MNISEPLKAKLTLLSVYFTFFIDNLSWSIVFPIFAPYFLDPENVLFSPEVPNGTRAMILGFFLMIFSLGQFFGAPVMGEYADRSGRKRALAVGVFFTMVGMGISAWSMQIGSLPLLFIGRLLTGIFASNLSVCLACVSDLSKDENVKAKYFGYLSVAAGSSFVIGAFLGGKLSDPTIHSFFTPYFPFWIGAGLCLINFLFILFAFRETFEVDPSIQFDFFQSFRNVKEALQTGQIKRVYAVYFLFLFAWTVLFQFIPVIVVDQFSFTNSNIGDLALFMGICWAIGSGYLNPILIQRFHRLSILECCLIGFTVFCSLIIFPSHIYTTLAILGVCVVLGAVAWPLCNGLISSMASTQMQGKVLGVSQSVQSLAMALAPALGGLAFDAHPTFPFLLGAGASSLAAILYFTLKDR
jgi:DHA1 family tetracycline resistance protein-like MFS transporter